MPGGRRSRRPPCWEDSPERERGPGNGGCEATSARHLHILYVEDCRRFHAGYGPLSIAPTTPDRREPTWNALGSPPTSFSSRTTSSPEGCVSARSCSRAAPRRRAARRARHGRGSSSSPGGWVLGGRADDQGGGRRGWRVGRGGVGGWVVQREAMSWRCQRRIVAGVTSSPRRRRAGSSRVSAAMRARSIQFIRGRGVRRWSTASWWHRSRISISLAVSDLLLSSIQPRNLENIR